MYRYRNQKQVLAVFDMLRKERGTKKYLDVLKTHHKDTYEHSLRVAKLSIDLALEHRLPLQIVKTIGRAALLHDFGKHLIDEKILSKSGPLDKKELSLMNRHPRLGITELKKFLSPVAKKIIISHHEFKAKPYPRSFADRRESIRPVWHERRKIISRDPLAQIVAAADMYDALSFPRSYKERYHLDKVRHIMIEEFAGQPSLIEELSKRPVKENKPRKQLS